MTAIHESYKRSSLESNELLFYSTEKEWHQRVSGRIEKKEEALVTVWAQRNLRC